CNCLIGKLALMREEELRRRKRQHLAGTNKLRLHAASEPPGTDARKSNTVAMIGVHIGLDLEDEGAHLRLTGPDPAQIRLLIARTGRKGGQPFDQVAYADIAQSR